MAQARRLNGSKDTSVSVPWTVKDDFDVIRIPIERYDTKINHYESDGEVIQRLLKIYKELVKFNTGEPTPAKIGALDNMITDLVHPISKEPHSTFPWSEKKKVSKK